MKNPLFVGMIILSIFSCARAPEKMVGPTTGSVDIIADESIRYIIEQEENIFERNYKHANVNITYLPEQDMFDKFMNDSVRVIITTRPLSEDELAYFDKRQSHPIQTSFATSALAFILKKGSPDTSITYENLLGMFRDSTRGKIFVIEDAKSGITNEVLELTGTNELPSHFYALDSKQEIIDYVLSHDNAIGIIDWSDISDSDHPWSGEVLNSIALAGISRPLDSVQHGFVKPFQYNLQDDVYPFTRDLYYITRTGKSDVSAGFASFIAGEIGQKIILKSGLLPRYQSERILEIKTTSDINVIE